MKKIGGFTIQDWWFTYDEPVKEKDEQIILYIFSLLPGYFKTVKFQKEQNSTNLLHTMTPNLPE